MNRKHQILHSEKQDNTEVYGKLERECISEVIVESTPTKVAISLQYRQSMFNFKCKTIIPS